MNPSSSTNTNTNSTNTTTSAKVYKPQDSSKEVNIGQYKMQLDQRLGGGSFGEIFCGYETINPNNKVAIKLESQSCQVPQLAWEYKIMKALMSSSNEGNNGIPKALYFSPIGQYNFLVMEELGNTLENLMLDSKYSSIQKFTLKTTLLIADQILSRIEHMHNNQLIHRDIKPENFLIGNTKKTKHIIYLIDYGLSKKYMSRNEHIPYSNNKEFTGTARFASIYTHKGIEQSRRDDLEAIGYLLVYFYKGTLPWIGLGDGYKSKNEKYEKIAELKRSLNMDNIKDSMFPEMVKYFEYVKALQFDEKPDYQKLKKLFKDVGDRKGVYYDYVFDWEGSDKKVSVL